MKINLFLFFIVCFPFQTTNLALERVLSTFLILLKSYFIILNVKLITDGEASRESERKGKDSARFEKKNSFLHKFAAVARFISLVLLQNVL